METLLKVQNLKVYYRSILGEYKVVDDVSFEVYKNEIFGIAGESGCGKSTLVEAVLGLIRPPGYIADGKVIFDGVNLRELDEEKFRRIRWRKLSYIPQGSMNSLNPVLRVEEQIADAIKAHAEVSEDEINQLVISSLNMVGLPEEVARMYPHELSGGMKQRVIIAMATALRPSLVIADEPVTALDVVSTRVNLQTIARLKRMFGMTVVLVAHDMAVHAEVCDRIAVMYAGKIVEVGPVNEIFENPLHPYTQGLLKAILSLEKRKAESISGLAPSPLSWPLGCRFHPRCPYVMDVCKEREPRMVEVSPGHYVACHLIG